MADVELYPGWEGRVGDASDPGVRAKAEASFDWAYRIAPVDTGEYRSKLFLVPLPGGGYRLVALAGHSIYVEFGTSRMAGYHTLAIALDAAKG